MSRPTDIYFDIVTPPPLPKRRKWVVCKDGFTLSIQAGTGLYCTPRTNQGPYSEVEAAYPSEHEPLLEPYLEVPRGSEFFGSVDVFSYVPSSVIRAVIAKHGGQVDGECPPLEGGAA